ncbi:MAG: SMC-Scp complex subunit ScpB [Conchiformibius sp.]|nr:SMC-Scp complex subunit ScpB [Conchiformibius sp.]
MDSLPPDVLIEAALLTQGEALSETTLRRLCQPELSAAALDAVWQQLQQRWQGRALNLVKTVDGWRFQVAAPAFERLGSLNEQRTPRYSRAVIETLAVIAYRQPVTRGDIEAVRGVSVSQNIIHTLQERGWIEIIGHRDSIGKPALWGTTTAFLNDLQLNSLHDLPPLNEIDGLTLTE